LKFVNKHLHKKKINRKLNLDEDEENTEDYEQGINGDDENGIKYLKEEHEKEISSLQGTIHQLRNSLADKDEMMSILKLTAEDLQQAMSDLSDKYKIADSER